MATHQIPSTPLQFFVKLLNGKSLTLQFPSPSASTSQIKQKIYESTKIPPHLQRLLHQNHQLTNTSTISQPDSTVTLVLSLPGGKGGFGSLLRGAATKAGQKKTNNFDACRDMSGRRLRHVNAEKRLEEWKEGEEERRMERLASEFLKKHEKKVKDGVGSGVTQKYVKKYKEEVDKCSEAVELALRESFGSGKRKGKEGVESEKAKRLKIWKGKRAVEASDSDDSSDEEGDEKSVVLNNGSLVVSDKDSDESSGSVMAGANDGDSSSGKASCNSGSEEEKDVVVHQSSDAPKEEIIVNEAKVGDSPLADAEPDVMGQSGKVEVACETVKNEGNDSEVKPGVAVEIESVDAEPVGPLNFDDFNAATDMEVLGMERLKTELQSRGLKCGGTLQERAARLFLLKSTPLDKLPKKLLAKK